MQNTAAPAEYVEQEMFRVTADWPGGGFSYTIPATNQAAARAWGEQKARFHADACVMATPRAQWLEEARIQTAGPGAFSAEVLYSTAPGAARADRVDAAMAARALNPRPLHHPAPFSREESAMQDRAAQGFPW
jgi:hypothetical protein